MQSVLSHENIDQNFLLIAINNVHDFPIAIIEKKQICFAHSITKSKSKKARARFIMCSS